MGRISYVFSDKTGTLTKNEIIFKKIALESDQYGEEQFKDLISILSDECSRCDAPLLDLLNLQNKMSDEPVSEGIIDTSINESFSASERRRQKRVRRQKNKIIRDTIAAMVLCNNVTPIVDEEDPSKISYQASSPDEVALVKFAETLNMRLIARTDKEIRIKDSADNIEEFEVLANFPFSSDTKRM